MEGYTFYDKPHGGTLILIKSRLRYFVLNSTTRNIDSNDEITFSAVYWPTRFKIAAQKFIDFFRNLGRKFLVSRDYNAKHTY